MRASQVREATVRTAAQLTSFSVFACVRLLPKALNVPLRPLNACCRSQASRPCLCTTPGASSLWFHTNIPAHAPASYFFFTPSQGKRSWVIIGLGYQIVDGAQKRLCSRTVWPILARKYGVVFTTFNSPAHQPTPASVGYPTSWPIIISRHTQLQATSTPLPCSPEDNHPTPSPGIGHCRLAAFRAYGGRGDRRKAVIRM
ncbi:hypothetical protein B0H19DRAFT_156488 [Mycena capillaripes]|nr:hypothetical protein B0H19DRAFT_156488 [Mycena capillaripes]